MLTRRSLLGGALAALPLSVLWRRTVRADGFGPLVADPDGVLDLPAGFRYRILDRVGDPMSDGYRTPGRPDGMACFAGPAGALILVRNHELSRTDGAMSAYGSGQAAPGAAYDDRELGGVTRLVVDGRTLEPISSNLILVGTTRNCAGGMSPWGWLSCEEDVGITATGRHGYVFVCPADADGLRAPRPIPAYGRFEHEAAVVDPDTRIAYLTEDRGDSCFYRFVPTHPGDPFTGTLQALRVVGTDRFDTSRGRRVGDAWPIAWVDIDEPDPDQDTVRVEAARKGAALVKRGEGAWFDGGSIWFVSTSGGPVSGGQVFRLDPDGDGGTLTLVGQSEDRDVLDMPDNITVAPWGDVYLAEDGSGDQYLRILAPDGSIADFARNALSGGELTGVCFSPDGGTLFVSLQVDGLTLAITGPFPRAPEPDPDGGVPVPPDAGTPPTDGGAPEPDANSPDPGSDAGTPPGGDPGMVPDPTGCACDAGDGPGLGGVIVAATTAAVLARRR